MLGWLSVNIGTIVITLVLLGIVTAVLIVMHSDKKKGISSCGGNCGHCPMNCSCKQNSQH